MNTQRWLIEYDAFANVQHFVETAATQGVRIVGVYPEAFALVAEASEKNLQRWVATLAVRSVRSSSFPEEEAGQEANPHRRNVMEYWNQYLATSPQTFRPHEGLSWDHPGFLPPDRPGSSSGNEPD